VLILVVFILWLWKTTSRRAIVIVGNGWVAIEAAPPLRGDVWVQEPLKQAQISEGISHARPGQWVYYYQPKVVGRHGSFVAIGSGSVWVGRDVFATATVGNIRKDGLRQTLRVSTPIFRISLWILAIAPLGMVFLLVLLVWIRKKYRLTRHLCIACGYNLIGNRSWVCSECGARITNSQQRSQ